MGGHTTLAEEKTLSDEYAMSLADLTAWKLLGMQYTP